MKSLDIFDRELHNIVWVAHILGVDLFKEKLVNWRVAICISVIFAGSLSVLYTIYIIEFDFILTLKCISATTQAVLGITKLIYTLKTKGQIEAMLKFLRMIYLVNATTTPKRIEVLNKAAENFTKMIKSGWLVFLFILLIICVYPAFSILYLKKHGFFIEVHFIGFRINEETTLLGYILNYFSQSLEVFYGYFGNSIYDLIFLTLILHVHTLIEFHIVAFNECEALIGVDSKAFDEQFFNCMIMIQDTSNYILALKKVYSPVVFVEVTSGAIAMGLSLFCIFTTDWLGAYGFFLLGFLQVLLYCSVGTFLEILDEKLLIIIYDFRWYLIPVRSQKLIFFTMMKAQLPSKLYIGNVAELNVSTAASIYKMIYSYLMMLLSFIK